MWTKFGYKKPDDGERIIWVNTVTGIISDVIASTSLGYCSSDFWEYFPVEDLNSDIKEAEKAVFVLRSGVSVCKSE